MDQNTIITEALIEIDRSMKRITEETESIYEEATEIWAKSLSLLDKSPELMHPLWLIWGALTDWVEIRPEETQEAEEKMRQAAREWLKLDRTDSVSMKKYFDRWVYDEMAYERNSN